MSWIIKVVNLNIYNNKYKINIDTHSFKYIKTNHVKQTICDYYIEREYFCSKCKASLCIYREITVGMISYDDYKPWNYSCEELIMLKVLK